MKYFESIYRKYIRHNVLMLLIGLLASISVHAAEPVKIGVLAYRSKPQTLAQWQPLAAALKQAIPDRDFVIEALTYPELDRAVASRQLDFVLTNSSHYVLLSKHSGLSSPLATLADDADGLAVSVFGGVIFQRTEDAGIDKLADLKGATIAATSAESLGGYQMQAYELGRAGIHLPQDVKLLITGMPQDNVVEAVLAGRAKAGFVRSGLLEAMAREGRLDIERIRVVNRQILPGFPVQVSTRLYPEWPFAALPHIDENLARRVAAVLFVLEQNSAATRAIGIHGFVIPADYTPIADMLRELRMPPFDVVPEFTLADVWSQYRWQLIAILLACGLILFLFLRLLWTITELKLAKEALHKSHEHLEDMVRERTRQLEASNKELEEFSYSMSHDMRTPLRALDGFSKMLMEEHGDNLNDEGRRLLKVLRDNAQHMGRLVDDILRFLSMGRRKMELGPVDIAGLTQEIFAKLQSDFQSRRLRLEIGAVPPAWGDSGMIREVLQNLLSNAVKFSPVDGEVLIEVGGESEGLDNCYYVKDYGAGFDMRYANKLFRVFERVHPTGQYQGSGIGLAIVKRIIERHGGRVWAEGHVGEGATFHFSLPLNMTL
jgi:signal transduction histidine kinase